MDYQDFLKMPYWKAIAAHVKYKAGYRCQLCNNSYYLVAHHRDYSIHGREHAYINDLIVLCDNCHSKFHDKIPKSFLRKYYSKNSFNNKAQNKNSSNTKDDETSIEFLIN